METEISEVEALPDCRDRLGRRTKSREERERLLFGYEGSGLTQLEYCRREGINIHTFTSWRHNMRKRTESKRELGVFREVEVSKPKNEFEDLKLRISSQMEVTGSAESLARLIRLLG